MAAKKITNAISYLGSASNIPQPIANLVPNFENSGVRYQGFYKIDKGNGNYELRKQTTRFYSYKIQNTAGFDNSFSRSNITQTFYAGLITFDYDCNSSPLQVTVYDGATANPRARVYLEIGTGHITLDLSNCPRKFSGSTIILSTDATLGATEFINMNLFGWEEE